MLLLRANRRQNGLIFSYKLNNLIPSALYFNQGHYLSESHHLDLYKWNSLIKDFIQKKDNSFDSPLLIYKNMLQVGVRPSGQTFMYLIKATAIQFNRREGEELHGCILKIGFRSNQFVSSALIGLYAVCGLLDSVKMLFDEMREPGLVSWTAVIRAYVCGYRSSEALTLFRQMRLVDLMPDSVAMATVVSACTQLKDLGSGRILHGFIVKCGINFDAFLCSGMISMYGESGGLDFARQLFDETPIRNVVVWNTLIHQCVEHNEFPNALQLFDEMPQRDTVTWNTMIGGLIHMGQGRKALEFYNEMGLCNVRPNVLTFSMALSACASLGALHTGMWIHAFIEKNNFNSDGFLDHCFIDMYSKCGSIEKALQVFEKNVRRDLFSWTSIICGLAIHGHAEHALNCFSQMLVHGINPDRVTLVGVLNACSHAGFVEEGRAHFQLMEKNYGITPTIEHYGCMIDLLCRFGELKEAYAFIMEMPLKTNEVIWGSLLSACRVHKDVELGEIACKRMLMIDPLDTWASVTLSNIYAEAGLWDRVMEVRKQLKERGNRKIPGCSSIEVNGMIHEFVVGDILHPQHAEIVSMLQMFENEFTFISESTPDIWALAKHPPTGSHKNSEQERY